MALFPRPKSIHTATSTARAPIGVAARWRKRHPCPRPRDEQCGQDEGTGRTRAGNKPSATLHRSGNGHGRQCYRQTVGQEKGFLGASPQPGCGVLADLPGRLNVSLWNQIKLLHPSEKQHRLGCT